MLGPCQPEILPVKWEHIIVLFSFRPPRNTFITILYSHCCQLLCVVLCFINGFQGGHVASRFKGQGSAKTYLPLPDAEDKAHIESRPWKLRGSESVFPGFSDILSGYLCFSLRKQLYIFWLNKELLLIHLQDYYFYYTSFLFFLTTALLMITSSIWPSRQMTLLSQCWAQWYLKMHDGTHHSTQSLWKTLWAFNFELFET